MEGVVRGGGRVLFFGFFGRVRECWSVGVVSVCECVR